MNEEIKPTTTAPIAAPKKIDVKQRGMLLLQIIGVIVVVFIAASLYRTVANQASQLEAANKDVLEQKDQLSSLTAQVNSLNDKIKEYKTQADAVETSVNEEKETVASLKKNYDGLEAKMTDLNQEFDDKFGRISKEVGDVKQLVEPVKADISAMKEENQKWQKDYVAALSDLQTHVTRAAGLISQMRDEMNKKIDFISMVQEKMIKEAAAVPTVPTIKSPVSSTSEQVIRRQVLNSDLGSGMDKAEYSVQNSSK